MLQRFSSLAVLLAALAVAGCVDTTGLSATSSRPLHPKSNPNAAVIVQEFADFQCPACKAAHTVIVQPLLESHGTRIAYKFEQFPLASIHRYAVDAAEASECAADQGKFWEFVDLAFAEQDTLNRDTLGAWGKKLGLNTDTYERCRASHIKRDTVLDEYEAGRTLGVSGTPTFMVNGRKVESTLEAIQKAIEDATTGAAKML